MIDKLKHIFIASVTIAASILLLASCITEVGCEEPEAGTPSLTLLVYLAGDNNLSPIAQIPETLLQAWKYTGNRCLIYYDAPDAAPKLLSLRGGCSVNPLAYIETIAEYTEENSASAETFSRVVDDVKRMYPADSYGLLFCSHASGWLPCGGLSQPSRSVGSDKDLGMQTTPQCTEMELSEFAAVIPDHHYDFIIFESCLMAGVEVAYELRNKTEYILASSAELLSPGFLRIYKSSFADLMNSKLPIEDRLKQMGQNYYNDINTQSGVKRSATLSLIKTKKMEELAAFTKHVIKGATTNKRYPDLSKLQHFDRPGSYGDNPAAPRYFDFGQYIEQLSEPDQSADFFSLMNDIVIWKASTPYFMEGENGFKIEYHSGLTTYIEQNIFPHLNEAWRQTTWGQSIKQRE